LRKENQSDMIQRIQTIYLLAAAALLGGAYFLPFAQANVAPEGLLVANTAFADGQLTLNDSQGGLGSVIVAAIFCIIAIFRYSNRLRQLSSVWVGFLGALIGSGLMAYEFFGGAPPVKAALGVGGLLPIAAMICMLLAVRAIRKDEALVKSIDRLR
jgi:Domain of unknown function (DUF4293)